MAAAAACAVVVATCSLLRSTDLKRVVAYASVAHMNQALLALAAGTAPAKRGFWLLMLAHGVCSAGLFAAVGHIYEQAGKRDLKSSAGVSWQAPVWL